MIMINDYEYTTEYGHSYSCLSCGDPIEHGEVRARVRYSYADGDDVEGWAHEDCALDEEWADAERRTFETAAS